MPPPNVTGKLHMGHAMFLTIQDIMIRYRRMKGHKTLWLPGCDHAGIATQMVVERHLRENEGVSRQDLGREEFEKRIWDWKDQYGGFIQRQIRRMGSSCDWNRERFTLDEQLSTAVVEAFRQLHDAGLIYRGTYMVNWSPSLRTAVSDLEVEYKDVDGKLYYFKYPIVGDGEGSGEFLEVATSRPETILGDTAVCVHPEGKFKHLIGRKCRVPVIGREIPIIADEFVDEEFGSGAVKITPGHDPNDYEVGQRHDLPIVNIMNRDATMNDNAGAYNGLDRFDCRKKLWADMKQQGLTIKIDNYSTRVPISQRGGEIIEPLVSQQWFVKMDNMAKQALEAVSNGDIKIIPDYYQKIYNRWLTDIKDWCISRQLWWGHRIPVWYVFESEQSAQNSEDGRSNKYVVSGTQEGALNLARQKYGPEVVVMQEEDVLDTWFSSGLWPFSTLGWPQEIKDLETYYPTQMMETGHDILFFWVARMIMMGMFLTNKPPFSIVYLHGLVRDENNQKMSKSKGNVIDPIDTIEQYGTDALRFTLATGTAPGEDLRLSLERVNANRAFTNKIWNVAKFVLYNLSELRDEEFNQLADVGALVKQGMETLPLVERWMLSMLHEACELSQRYQEEYKLNEAGRLLYSLIWDQLADWYVEAAKSRLYGDDPQLKLQCRRVLVYTLDTVLRLLHPFMPYVTEEIWQAIPHKGESLMLADWPTQPWPVDQLAVAQFECLQGIVRTIRKAREEYNVEPSRKIDATILVEDTELKQGMATELSTISLLAKLNPQGVSVISGTENGKSRSEGVIEAVVTEGVEVVIPLAGLIDVEKEQQRLDKQKAKIQKSLDPLLAQLQNEKFISKAPAAKVEEVKSNAALKQEELRMVDEKIQKLAKLKE
eukprot:TRINITY_DN20546_c1_g1_i1.p1 TRINITY_DN20546_c1_g1~~TRINITY_DN20546_c1_g1_i1.p1  ORF type:complete len:982 (-),score=134.55 TRINITY_DN20546_c1_g1_i1:260-2899(-)